MTLQHSNNTLDHTTIEAYHAVTKNLSHQLVTEKHSMILQHSDNTLDHAAIEAMVMQLQKTLSHYYATTVQ